MKYIKKFEELDLDTYAGLMDKTELYPTIGFNSTGDTKKLADKMGRVNNMANKRFADEFYKKYPKNETKIYFKDKENTHELYFFMLKFNTNYTNYDLIFKTEGDKDVWIKNPFYIEQIDLEKISLLHVQIETESKKLINEMFNYGLSGDKVEQ